MSFCTAINCMDGRIQLPVIQYLQQHYDVPYVDIITEPGPIRILAEHPDISSIPSILKRLNISIDVHQSKLIAITGHHDCAGNPSPKDVQLEQIERSKKYISKLYPHIEVIGLWIDEHWQVHLL